MRAYGKRILREVLEGYGFAVVPREVMDEGFGCHRCDDVSRRRTYYCDFTLLPDGAETVNGYRKKVGTLRIQSWCAFCLVAYYGSGVDESFNIDLV